MKQIAVLLTLFVAALARSNVERANAFVDETIASRAYELEAIRIPEFPLTFRIPGGEAGLKLHGGNITGLEKITRTKDSVVRNTADDHQYTTYYIGVRDLKLYALIRYILYINYNIDVNGTLDEIEAEIKILRNNESKLRVVRSVKLTKFEGFNLTIDAPGKLGDTIVNAGLRATKIAYQPVVKYVIERRIKAILDEEIEARNRVVG